MKVTVMEETFWHLRGTETMFFYIEEEKTVKLYLPNNGYMICSEHTREDYLPEEQELTNEDDMNKQDKADTMYMLWKAENLTNGGTRIVEYDDGKVNIKVS